MACEIVAISAMNGIVSLVEITWPVVTVIKSKISAVKEIIPATTSQVWKYDIFHVIIKP